MRNERNKQLYQSFKSIAKKLQQKWDLRKKYLKEKDKPISKSKGKPFEKN